MSSKEVYRDFIQQAASQQKSIILWDAQRRYEGRFKSFDSSGDYVILSDVTIVQPEAVMNVSELLLPLVSLKIVSSGYLPPSVEAAPGFVETAQPQPGPLLPAAETASTQPFQAPELPVQPILPDTALPSSPEDESVLPSLPAEPPAAPGEPSFSKEETIPTIIQPLPKEETGPSWASESKIFEEKPPLAGNFSEGAPLPGISFSPETELPKTEESLRIPTLEELMGIAPTSAAGPAVLSPTPQVISPAPPVQPLVERAPSIQPPALKAEQRIEG